MMKEWLKNDEFYYIKFKNYYKWKTKIIQLDVY